MTIIPSRTLVLSGEERCSSVPGCISVIEVPPGDLSGL
jgi:hypothetical protein